MIEEAASEGAWENAEEAASGEAWENAEEAAIDYSYYEEGQWQNPGEPGQRQ